MCISGSQKSKEQNIFCPSAGYGKTKATAITVAILKSKSTDWVYQDSLRAVLFFGGGGQGGYAYP